MMSQLAGKWAALSEQERAVFHREAEKAKEAAEHMSPEQKGRKAQLILKQLKKQSISQAADSTFIQAWMMSQLAGKWAALSEQERAVFHREAEKAKEAAEHMSPEQKGRKAQLILKQLKKQVR
ncbi:hypothetical protein SKAU_G00104960 [Synaphobranchus kaupii]|uniref:Uncharacterized protein n=1 Tax=Synaphobranchus kaupii TaxID=118154 RepID=A0A9Q1G033_SYNKA|nr:hypothetical protein SKAU_G00104960 [Synaphobranchus kaupii]